jgi:beta-N-acetylhexosaminidase
MLHRLIYFACLCTIPAWGFISVKDMTLEEKVGQVLMVHFHGEAANEDAKRLVQDTHVGGIIYYNWANGLSSPHQVQTLSFGLQKLAQKNRLPIPLFIGADQEGGIVERLTHGFTVFPGNKALGETGRLDLAEKSAHVLGQETKAVGINMNFAPVVDVNNNARNPVIGIRSFSDVPETVVSFGKKALQGYRQASILTCLKHFPGHGDVTVDSHEDLPVLNKTKEELEKVELLPFAKLASHTDTIMTAHILVPALDPEHCSTLSEKVLGYLRNQIGFQGVIVTDSLVMEGVLKKCGSVDEAAIQSFIAGSDILLLGGKQLTGGNVNLELKVSDVQRIHEKLVEAVKNGRISEKKLNQSVERILKLKDKHHLSQAFNHEPSHLGKSVNTASHHALAQSIASLALKTIKNDPSCLKDMSQKKIALIAPHLLRGNIEQTSLLKLGKETEALFFNGLAPSDQEIEMAKQQAATADVLMVCSYSAWENPQQITLIQSLIETGRPVVLLVVRDPLDATLFPKASVIMTTFSPTTPSLQAVCDQLSHPE